MQHLKTTCHCLWDTFDESKKQKERSTYYDINFLHGKILMDLLTIVMKQSEDSDYFR